MPIKKTSLLPRGTFSATAITATVLIAALGLCVPASSRAGGTDVGNDERAQIQSLIDEFCRADALETANYLLTQGTPDDVALMEEAIFLLESGEWVVTATMTGIAPANDVDGSSIKRLRVHVNCDWQTPFPDLNGDYDVELALDRRSDGEFANLRRLP